MYECVNVKNTRVREKEGERTGQEKRGGKIIFKYSYQNKKCVGPRTTGDRIRQERETKKMRNEVAKARKRGRTTKNIYNIWLQVQITSTTERRCIDV